MKIIEVDIGLLKPYENNAKLHDDVQVSNVAESIRQFGWQQPIVVDKNYVVIIGHCRLLAAKKLELEKVPVTIADNLSEEQVRKLRLLDNKTNESEWDYEKLAREIDGGGLENFEPLNFDEFNIDWGIEQIEDEVVEDNFDFDSNIPTNPKAKPGDIYKLGEHILMCGDSTNILDVEKLMGEETADLIVTDPPYNVNVEGSDGKTIENDNLPRQIFYEIMQKAFDNMFKFTRLGGAIYCFHGDNEGITFRTAFEKSGFKLSECLIWVKNGLVLSRQDYHWRHEPILYGWKEGFAHYFVDDRTQDTVLEDKLDIDKLSKQELKDIIKKMMNDKVATTIIREDKPIKNAEHPTMKPLPLLGRLIRNSSRPKEIVLDLFGGSGSTLITCEQLNRKCRMMELDPRYVDAIIKRYEDFTGNKAELINE